MKTLELELKKYVLIVEAPLDAYDVSIGTHCIGVRTNENVEKDTNGFYHIYEKGLFFGDFNMKLEYICKGSELTEGKIKEFDLIETKKYGSKPYFCTLDYRNKGKNKNGFNPGYCSPNGKQFTNSFISAVESKGFYWLEKECDNQFCENGKVDVGYNTFLNCQVCEEAEEKTFRNPLIFVKK